MSKAQAPSQRRGRGTGINPDNRFENLQIEPDFELEHESDSERSDPARLKTQFYHDHSKSIISYNKSPDVGFHASFNPYRGCEHGCIYCYARPTHEYLGFSSGLDFESKIMVKLKAPELLRAELSAKKWQPAPLALSGVTDAYQPIEKKLGITRGCLEVLAEFRNPVAIITKNHLVTRDIDILQRLAQKQCALVFLSITSLDSELTGRLEPRTSRPGHRLQAVRELSAAGIPVGVMLAPIIPALNDAEIPTILEAAAQAGARWAGYTIVRLPYAVKDLFQEWLARHYPERQAKILNRLLSMRGDKLNQSEFGKRMRGEGIFAQEIEQRFKLFRRKYALEGAMELSVEHFRRPIPPGRQMDLF